MPICVATLLLASAFVVLVCRCRFTSPIVSCSLRSAAWRCSLHFFLPLVAENAKIHNMEQKLAERDLVSDLQMMGLTELNRRLLSRTEQMEYYKAMMERAEKSLPIADIHSVESQDESIAIYHAAPYRLSLMKATSVNATLQQLYSKYKHTVVSRDMFLKECKTLQDWLKSK